MKKYIINTIVVLAIFVALSIHATADYAEDGWAPTTKVTETIDGSVFTDYVEWNGQTTLTLSSNVPNDGTVRHAYLYGGTWHGTENSWGYVNVNFNGDESSNGLGPIHLQGSSDINPNVWCTGHGKSFYWYDVTNLVNPGEVNTAVITKINSTQGSFDGRVYGIALVVVFENSASSEIQYWINDGSDGLNYNQPPHNSGTTHFNGDVDTGSVTNSALTVIHLTGYSPTCDQCLDFNDHPLETGHVNSNTFEMNTWDETNSDVTPANVIATGNHADYRRGEDPYINVCTSILVLQKEASTQPDLIVTDIEFPTVMRPGKDHTISATIVNQGSACGGFTVGLYIDDNPTPIDTAYVAGLPASGNIVVNIDVNIANADCYSFKVVADINGNVGESDENNNDLSEDYQVGYVIVVENNDDFDKLALGGDFALPSGCYENTSGTHYIQDLTGDYSVENCVGKGITIKGTTETFVIRDCTVKNCLSSGVWIHDLDYGTVRDCTIHNNLNYGIEVGLVPLDSNDPNYINILCNDLYQNLYGIEIIGYHNTVKGNSIRDSTDYGVYVNGDFNEIYNNSIKDNDNYGIKAYDSSNNYIYRNDFIDNNGGEVQGYDDGTTNTWNSASTSSYPYDCTLYTNYIGNHWSDHTGSHTNGIVNTPYSLEGGTAVDNYPQVVLWRKCGDVNREGTVNVIGDVQLLFNKVVYGCSSCPGINLWASDVNCQDGVNVFDTSRLFLNQIYGDPLCCCLPDCKICCCE